MDSEGASCPMPDPAAEALVREHLGTPRVVAVVGMSPNPHRPSNEVGAYLAARGFTVIPVHPRAETVAGFQAYADLPSIPADAGVEIVDLFVAAARQGDVVEQAHAIGARAVWFQPGTENPPLEQRARELGLEVVSGKCTMAEHRRLFGSS
jgi:uncharacterized protein